MKISSIEDLKPSLQRVGKYETRFGVEEILNYVELDLPIICGVTGLRRTGKTTMLWQAMDALHKTRKVHSLYMEMENDDCMDDLTCAIEKYAKNDCKNFFIDEITNLHDFSVKAAPLANTYAARGLKIIISGTDSLLLNISSRDSLYNRIKQIKTTWMPWREYVKITGINNGNFSNGIHSFDDYLENGGILYNDQYEKNNIKEYIQTSIINNLIHSLDNDDNGRNYEELGGLRNNGKLKNFILNVLNDNTHRFIVNLLTSKYHLDEFENARGIVHRHYPNITKKETGIILDASKKKLGYIDWKPGEPLPHNQEIMAVNEWLQAMDVFIQDPIRPELANAVPEYIHTQPALRWHQVLNVFDEIFKSDLFVKALGQNSAVNIHQFLTNGLKGEILEDMVLADAINTLKNDSNVFSWKFSGRKNERKGEFDMVIARNFEKNHRNLCDIFEIKKNDQYDWEQARHLRYAPYLKYFDDNLHRIRYRTILYRGSEFIDFDGIMYLNVEKFLYDLQDYHEMIQRKYDILKEERDLYNHNATIWINVNIDMEQFKKCISKYFNREVVYKEMPFAAWLANNNINIPDVFELEYDQACPHDNKALLPIGKHGITWDDLQNTIAIYDVHKHDKSFEDWLNIADIKHASYRHNFWPPI